MQLLDKLNKLKKVIDFSLKERELVELQTKLANPSIWDNPTEATEISVKYKKTKDLIEKVLEIELLLKDSQIEEASVLLEKLEIYTYLSGKYDQSNAYVGIYSGTGGTEAMDWAQMLEKMYLGYFELKGFAVTLLERSTGEEVGIKSVVYNVVGDFAYGLLKNEAGTHRLVRQSPFNADSLRQTSFAKVEVTPEIKSENLVIKDADLQITTTHSRGAGGQNVNKVESAVRIKHIPSGLVVSCQAERSQPKNKELALAILKSKLELIHQENIKKVEDSLRKASGTASWGTQIRSYVLHPYKQIKDLRSGLIEFNVDSFLQGNIDKFIEGNLRLLSDKK